MIRILLCIGLTLGVTHAAAIAEAQVRYKTSFAIPPGTPIPAPSESYSNPSPDPILQETEGTTAEASVSAAEDFGNGLFVGNAYAFSSFRSLGASVLIELDDYLPGSYPHFNASQAAAIARYRDTVTISGAPVVDLRFDFDVAGEFAGPTGPEEFAVREQAKFSVSFEVPGLSDGQSVSWCSVAHPQCIGTTVVITDFVSGVTSFQLLNVPTIDPINLFFLLETRIRFQDTVQINDGGAVAYKNLVSSPYDFSGEVNFGSTISFKGLTISAPGGAPLPHATVTSLEGNVYPLIGAAVPEPGTWSLMLLGIAGGAIRFRRARRWKF
jgi:hypothetical protein